MVGREGVREHRGGGGETEEREVGEGRKKGNGDGEEEGGQWRCEGGVEGEERKRRGRGGREGIMGRVIDVM